MPSRCLLIPLLLVSGCASFCPPESAKVDRWAALLDSTTVRGYPAVARMDPEVNTPTEPLAAKFRALQDSLPVAEGEGVPIWLTPRAALAAVKGWEAQFMLGHFPPELPLGDCIKYVCLELGLGFRLTRDGLLIFIRDDLAPSPRLETNR